MASSKKTAEEKEAAYQEYLSREGPKNLGSVTWPAPSPGSLGGMKLRATGVCETIERQDLNNLITQSSGHVMSGFSKNLDYLIVGRDAGPVKLEKAKEYGVKTVSEDQFLNLMKDNAGEKGLKAQGSGNQPRN